MLRKNKQNLYSIGEPNQQKGEKDVNPQIRDEKGDVTMDTTEIQPDICKQISKSRRKG